MARRSVSCWMGACDPLSPLVSGDSSNGMGPRICGVLHHAPDFGAGESVAYPCYSKILASDFPQHHRGLANSIIDAASKMGPALGTLLGGVLMARLGWRWFFIGLGIGSLVWLIPWIIYMPRDRAAETVSKPKGPSLTELLSKRSALGSFVAHFCGNYYWFFLLTWLPSYLVQERKYSMDRMAVVGSVAYVAIAIATIIAGWWSDRKIAHGKSPTFARKACVCGGLVGADRNCARIRHAA